MKYRICSQGYFGFDLRVGTALAVALVLVALAATGVWAPRPNVEKARLIISQLNGNHGRLFRTGRRRINQS